MYLPTVMTWGLAGKAVRMVTTRIHNYCFDLDKNLAKNNLHLSTSAMKSAQVVAAPLDDDDPVAFATLALALVVTSTFAESADLASLEEATSSERQFSSLFSVAASTARVTRRPKRMRLILLFIFRLGDLKLICHIRIIAGHLYTYSCLSSVPSPLYVSSLLLLYRCICPRKIRRLSM